MKAVLALLLGVTYGADVDQKSFSKLLTETSWKEEVTRDWGKIDHAAAFAHWKREFGKQYENLEAEGNAFITFLENWKMINDFNIADNDTFKMGMNQFSDLTGDEFLLYIHGHNGSCVEKRYVDRVEMTDISSGIEAPEAIDWTDIDGKSYVTAVKNQASCGSCWAFSATGAIEARSAIKQKVTGDAITTLSEQQLIDCSRSYGNMGCNGGLMDSAFAYVEHAGGLCTEAEYPYTARDGPACYRSRCANPLNDVISGYKDVSHDSERALMAAVAEGPVSIAIEADQSSFQFYRSGVLSTPCGTRIDHGVLVVGYGEENGQQFWKVKNSWGTTWGDEGYVKLCRDCGVNSGQGQCGILMQPSYPVA